MAHTRLHTAGRHREREREMKRVIHVILILLTAAMDGALSNAHAQESFFECSSTEGDLLMTVQIENENGQVRLLLNRSGIPLSQCPASLVYFADFSGLNGAPRGEDVGVFMRVRPRWEECTPAISTSELKVLSKLSIRLNVSGGTAIDTAADMQWLDSHITGTCNITLHRSEETFPHFKGWREGTWGWHKEPTPTFIPTVSPAVSPSVAPLPTVIVPPPSPSPSPVATTPTGFPGMMTPSPVSTTPTGFPGMLTPVQNPSPLATTPTGFPGMLTPLESPVSVTPVTFPEMMMTPSPSPTYPMPAMP